MADYKRPYAESRETVESLARILADVAYMARAAWAGFEIGDDEPERCPCCQRPKHGPKGGCQGCPK